MFFFFNDTATTEIYTLSLHGALPISDDPEDDARAHRARGGILEVGRPEPHQGGAAQHRSHRHHGVRHELALRRSEEHTSELQSQSNLVCRLLLEKKKKKNKRTPKDSR